MTKTKPKITVSINPTYFCNFDCSFCYLTPTQLNDQKLLPLETLFEKILKTNSLFDIGCIDIYGGEISLLPESYLDPLINFCKKYCFEINLITNLSVVHPSFRRDDVSLSVSWEGDIRRKGKTVFDNIKKVGRDVNLLMLASSEMLKWNESYLESIISKINLAENIKSVEVKPYSSNQSNSFALLYSDFEGHIKKWFSYEHSFQFINKTKLENVFSGVTNSFSDDHIYIDPAGEFCVLDFDENDNEYFLKLDSLDDYFNWSNGEKIKVSKNSFCSNCDYLGSCLSEHLRDVQSIEKSCNGFFHLIEWFRNEKT